MESTMAVGLVVSRGSSAIALFSSGSIRSRRVTWFPRVRINAVKPAGPPIWANKRLAAALSLTAIAAAQRSPTVIAPSWTCACVTGAYSSKSLWLYAIDRFKSSVPESTRFRILAAKRNLKVLHMANSSEARCSSLRPVAVSSAETPSRTPIRRSIAANSSFGNGSGAEYASNGRCKIKPESSRNTERREELNDFMGDITRKRVYIL